MRWGKARTVRDLCGHVERLAAAAGVYDIRVLEDKLGAHSIFVPVHLAPDDGEEGFTVDEHSDALLLYDLVELSRLFDVFEIDRKSVV